MHSAVLAVDVVHYPAGGVEVVREGHDDVVKRVVAPAQQRELALQHRQQRLEPLACAADLQ